MIDMKNNKKTICIYCLGEYGIQTYLKLKEQGVHVNFFGDHNPSKHGYVMDGVACIGFEDILAFDKESTIIIVAVKNPNILIKSFKDEGFGTVIDNVEALSFFECETKQTVLPVMNEKELVEIKERIADTFYRKVLPDIDNRIINQMLIDYMKRNKC